jgi:hypothetical protein
MCCVCLDDAHHQAWRKRAVGNQPAEAVPGGQEPYIDAGVEVAEPAMAGLLSVAIMLLVEAVDARKEFLHGPERHGLGRQLSVPDRKIFHVVPGDGVTAPAQVDSNNAPLLEPRRDLLIVFADAGLRILGVGVFVESPAGGNDSNIRVL